VFHVEQAGELRAFLIEGSAKLGLTFTEHQLTQFSLYHQHLTAWNEKINLTAITDAKEIAIKHILDSLAGSKVLRPGIPQASLLDIGSGAGFPGLPLKILYPDLGVTLLEPNQKKTAFLRHIIGLLNLRNTQVISSTVESFSRQVEQQTKFLYVVTRALNVISNLSRLRPLVADNGMVILYRSQTVHSEIQGWMKEDFALREEISYDLPYGAGKRILSIFAPRQAYVPRGTAMDFN
jgi:16S rRNA (guanine527-N7)-methyltransferase